MYLVEVEDQDELSQWLAQNHQALFEEELNGWYTDSALWPRSRSLKMLREWCSFELTASWWTRARLHSKTTSRKNE